MSVNLATASVASELLSQIAVRTRNMALHLADWANDIDTEARAYPQGEAELREVLSVLHDELGGVMERLGCDVIFDEPAEEPTEVVAEPEYYDLAWSTI